MQRSERRGGFSYSVIDWVRPAYIQGMCICTSIMCIYSYLDHGEVTQYNEAAQGFNKFFFFCLFITRMRSRKARVYK